MVMQVSASPAGAITDVAGIEVGHDTHPGRPTGCTVILTRDGAVAGVDVRGAAPGTCETELLAPENTVDQVHAVFFAGGSAFGLAAVGGVVRWLEEQGVGFAVGPARVPIVPGAILFDLAMGDYRIRPGPEQGYRACLQAGPQAPAQGSVGAGAGATVGKLWGIERAMKGGVGTASARIGGVTVGALVVVNAVGDVLDPSSGRLLAGARVAADSAELIGTTAAILRSERIPRLDAGQATTLACVATDAVLTKAQCRRLAGAGHDGLVRSIDPIHTPFDGDVVFALATGQAAGSVSLLALAATAAHVTALAVVQAVLSATQVHGKAVPPVPAWRDQPLA